jgi:hypothetical protein
MDLSSTLKDSFSLNWFTLEDEDDTIIQNAGNCSPSDLDELDPQHNICKTENP